jgi:hypothetical protein
MLVSGAAVLLKNRDGFRDPDNVFAFIGHALPSTMSSSSPSVRDLETERILMGAISAVVTLPDGKQLCVRSRHDLSAPMATISEFPQEQKDGGQARRPFLVTIGCYEGLHYSRNCRRR